ncbi:MAG: hypothetical protein IPN58_19775 [Anaerolineales bacterium]|nr:hypothetical protein [Anaerolineales bacterium]
MASITVTEGQQNLTAVSEIRLYGPAELITWGARPGEITAAISVADDAELTGGGRGGGVDDGRAELLPAALTIFPIGSGNTADEWAESGPGTASELRPPGVEDRLAVASLPFLGWAGHSGYPNPAPRRDPLSV